MSDVVVTRSMVAVHHPEMMSRLSLIIVDEVHHAGSETFSRILSLINGGALGSWSLHPR